ncbi:hypothetical protein G4Y79_05700 [Phototrophicus methaneseepsis]|uniref:Phage protein n=1 Tax=Phototrophicus methaneseepsis TaxID=2710758 RepID=A0A7S8EBT3_9CHLR|nr:hypothetical protein [Phototrophicus methaneseepsis]QPC83873.1 hypothetical protein G4Y79_05700 [Phototrophicus methaneseepsis]
MSSFRTALTRLANLSIGGVANNYDISTVPDQPGRAQLPALLVMPLDTADDRLFRERGEGFQTMGFSNGPKTVTYTVTHLLLVAPSGSSKGISAQLPTLVDLIDAYMAAFGDDPTLDDILLEPARVRIEPGIFPVGQTLFIGCAFRHTWLMEVI